MLKTVVFVKLRIETIVKFTDTKIVSKLIKT